MRVTDLPNRKSPLASEVKKPVEKKKAPVKVIEPIVEPKVEEEKIEIDLEDIRI